jgi:NhaA family Na+:H+ antiporter
MSETRSTQTILGRGSWSETTRIVDVLRKETVGGALLLVATIIAMTWANSPIADSYIALRDYKVRPESLHLHLSLGTWAADGVLAFFFFFVVGLDLKREFVAGDLRDPHRAALPMNRLHRLTPYWRPRLWAGLPT